MNRRQLIAGLGSAAALPVAARAQQAAVPVIGVLNSGSSDSTGRFITAFHQGLKQLGYTGSQNVAIEYRWADGQYDKLPALVADLVSRNVAVIAAGGPPAVLAAKAATSTIPIVFTSGAAELVALVPDVIVTNTGGLATDLQRASRTVPIVFTGANDPVGLGLVESIARPGTNATGLFGIEFSQSAKLLQLLREIAPRLMLVAVPRDPAFTGNFGVIQAMAGSLGIQVRPVDSREPAAIERGFAALAREPNGGVVVPSNTFANIHRDLIVKLAAQHRLPAVYGSRLFVEAGGLLSYGGVDADRYPRVAGYIDRILKGEKPADLPVQMATKYELVINLKTAKALGLTIPETLLATADEVIQ